jgi:uncharacterized protein
VIPFDRPPIVVDTNVLISAMLFDSSISAKALDKALMHHLFVQSEETLSELASTVRRKKFDKYKPLRKREQFLLTISRASKIVDITCTVSDCRDPKDNRFLELALSASSTLIVSGDDDLLSMHPYKGVDVVNPTAFIQRI